MRILKEHRHKSTVLLSISTVLFSNMSGARIRPVSVELNAQALEDLEKNAFSRHPSAPPPVYGDEWKAVVDDRTSGFVEFILAEGGPKDDEVVLSQFHPSEGLRNNPSCVYRKKICHFKRDATPEEAGFVLPPSKQLGQFLATAICGNDITSSVIYTPGLVAMTSGYYTPVCLFLVVVLLYCFRAIYVELVTALPLNGGTYTGILNTTRKSVAVIAACLSFLAYAATVVVSAASAMFYLQGQWSNLNTLVGTIVVIALFACLMLIGLRESAYVALVIFSVHMLTLALLICSAFAYACSTSWHTLQLHYRGLAPPFPIKAIFLGFSQSMLGITGFETSANFVEHQAPGVFAKTLRNMWMIVAFVNPVVSVLGFAVIPPDAFYVNGTLHVSNDTELAFLALMGKSMDSFLGGHGWLEKLIIADAFVVLCGAVLTGYVGVLGLLKRMVDDDIFPNSLLAQMPVTKTHYPIILFFCGVCITLILICAGDITSISGVYTLSFLSVMFLFCLSTLVLKHNRRDLKRDQKSKWYLVITCMCGLIVAMVGNCFLHPIIIGYTFLYFSVFMSIFYAFYARSFLIRAFLGLIRHKVTQGWCMKPLKPLFNYLVQILIRMENVPVVFFSRRLNLREMNQAVRRVLQDELSRRLTIVHLYEHFHEIPQNLEQVVRLLDIGLYPNIRIDVCLIRGKFGPGAVRVVEALLEVPPNRMFIVSPSHGFPYNVHELGSVRIIMSRREREGYENRPEQEQHPQVLQLKMMPSFLNHQELQRLAEASYCTIHGMEQARSQHDLQHEETVARFRVASVSSL